MTDTRYKIVIEYDPEPDFSWLEQDQYNPASLEYDPFYPSKADMDAKRNAYNGDWDRNPDNHVALCLLVFVIGPDDDDWQIIDSLGNIDFLVSSDRDWTTGTFYCVDDIPNECVYLRELASDAINGDVS